MSSTKTKDIYYFTLKKKITQIKKIITCLVKVSLRYLVWGICEIDRVFWNILSCLKIADNDWDKSLLGNHIQTVHFMHCSSYLGRKNVVCLDLILTCHMVSHTLLFCSDNCLSIFHFETIKRGKKTRSHKLLPLCRVTAL